jgi:hypothetical protein
MSNEFVARTGVRSLGGVIFPYTAVSTTYAVNVENYLVDCTTGTFTVTLPTAVGITGQIFVIKNSDLKHVDNNGWSPLMLALRFNKEQELNFELSVLIYYPNKCMFAIFDNGNNIDQFRL